MSRQATDQSQSVFLTLDGLRGYGSILVFVGHTMLYWGHFATPGSPVCVDMFFLLSGFVIAFAYEPRFAAGMGALEFMTHRIVRLYPLYLLALTAGVLIAVIGVFNEPDPVAYLSGIVTDASLQIFMLPSPDMAKGLALYSLNFPAWTLFFELIANLAYVLIWRRLSTPVLGALVVTFGVILCTVVINNGSLDMGWSWKGFAGGIARGFFGFFMGVLVFRLVGAPRRPNQARSLWPIYVFVSLTAVSFLPASPTLRPYLDLLLVIGLGAPLLIGGQMVQPPRALAALMGTLGRISYAVYILHIPLYEVMKRITWEIPALWDYTAYLGPVMLVIVMAAAYAAERWYDRPARRWIVSRLRMHAARNASRVPAGRVTMAATWGEKNRY